MLPCTPFVGILRCSFRVLLNIFGASSLPHFSLFCLSAAQFFLLVSLLPSFLSLLCFVLGSSRFRFAHLLPSFLFVVCFFFWQAVEGVAWPPGLEQLLFGRVFNQQIQRTVWASGLRQLALGDFFDQALNEVAWPASLERLSLGSKFNQVRWAFICCLGSFFSPLCSRLCSLFLCSHLPAVLLFFSSRAPRSLFPRLSKKAPRSLFPCLSKKAPRSLFPVSRKTQVQ